MPIVLQKAVSVQVRLTGLYINVLEGTARCYFTKYVGDEALPNPIEFIAEQADIVPILMSPATPGLARADDIALQVYAVAVRLGWFQGEVL